MESYSEPQVQVLDYSQSLNRTWENPGGPVTNRNQEVQGPQNTNVLTDYQSVDT